MVLGKVEADDDELNYEDALFEEEQKYYEQ